MILLINYSHKWWYKSLSILLVIALILAISFCAAPRAHAVGVLTMTVCAGILTVMAGAGIYAVVSGMTAADIQSWLQGKLQEWDIYRNDGNIFTDLIEENLFVMTVKGILRIGNAAVQGISDFISWLVSDIGLSDNESLQVVEGSQYPFNISDAFNVNSQGVNNVISGNTLYCADHSSITLTLSTPQLVEFDCYYTASRSHTNWNWIEILTSSNPNNDIVISNLVNTAANIGSQVKLGPTVINNSLTCTGSFHFYGTTNYIFISSFDYGTITETWANLFISNIEIVDPAYGNSLTLDSDVIGIPDVTQDENQDVYLGVDGVYPGSTIEEWTDVVMDGIVDNTLDSDMTISDEFVDAQEVVIVNEQAISVNTDHHMIGFTNLPDFVNLNLNSIWHYVSDAVEYASGFISWFVNLLSSVPTLAIPLYMSFTLLIVLSFIRRILL